MSHAPANPPRARTEVLADGSTVIAIAGDWSAQVATPEITFKGDRKVDIIKGYCGKLTRAPY